MTASSPASMGGPLSEADREYRERIEFTSRLGFGDDKTEPAARLADIVDHIEYAFSQSSDHIDCPAWCELCGERLADKDCEPCGGSGCGPRTAEGAYDECEHCAGVGRIHEGCVGKTYAELAAENALLEGQLATAREELAARPMPRPRATVKVSLTKCTWCLEDRREMSEWEQKNLRGFWKRLCKPCARKRLNNGYNALLGMRKVEEDTRALGLDGGGTDES